MALKSNDPADLNSEEWREYDFAGRIYRISSPTLLYRGDTTHRVVDSAGVVHCVPAPGFHGCVLRWKNKLGSKQVNF